MEFSERSTEARRANIIYFLNRDGRIEHPHLIRVHHVCHSGIHLRDVKRWLSELRGKEMPDSFAWSYQRRYKKALVWQDLKDDDLLTAISDSEYVLLGSLLPGAESKSGPFPSPEEKTSPENEQLYVEDGVLPDEDVEELEQRKTSPAGDAGRQSYPRKPSHVFRNFLACKAVDTVDSTLLAGGRGGVYGGLTKSAGSIRSPLRLQNAHVDNNKR
ncbi:hypothetical protein IEQ34_016355 [Dendrobium chrysotoxum]|uniref:SOSEKI DIX-like domain-containing protein n=1 Tax=Dendrobium chrysotoxum TaxID=161865 RepID=A0AAV7GEC1_DENCH|nr:hypothetical protein IEQ34_016355 [Dendrobium chrysotoxum]